MRKVLITGISGGQGRLVAERLLTSGRWTVTGVDRVPWHGGPDEITVHNADLRKRKFDNVVNHEKPDAVVHLGFVRHFRADPRVRHEVNVNGTQRLLEVCAANDVRNLVVLSSSYVYGASPDNPRYMREDHPLNVSRTFPEIRDLAEMEGLVGTFVWRYPDIATSVLRPVNTLGEEVHSAVGRYFKLRILPTVAGFDPMMQFIDEEDLADAIALALENDLHGVYNVAGPGAVPLSTAIREIGRHSVTIPEPLIGLVIDRLFRLGVYQFPAAALSFIKYPCTVSDARFVDATGFRPKIGLESIFDGLRIYG